MPPVLIESGKPPAPPGRRRLTGASDACSRGPLVRVRSEVKRDMMVVSRSTRLDFGLSDLARTRNTKSFGPKILNVRMDCHKRQFHEQQGVLQPNHI